MSDCWDLVPLYLEPLNTIREELTLQQCDRSPQQWLYHTEPGEGRLHTSGHAKAAERLKVRSDEILRSYGA